MSPVPPELDHAKTWYSSPRSSHSQARWRVTRCVVEQSFEPHFPMMGNSFYCRLDSTFKKAHACLLPGASAKNTTCFKLAGDHPNKPFDASIPRFYQCAIANLFQQLQQRSVVWCLPHTVNQTLKSCLRYQLEMKRKEKVTRGKVPA